MLVSGARRRDQPTLPPSRDAAQACAENLDLSGLHLRRHDAIGVLLDPPGEEVVGEDARITSRKARQVGSRWSSGPARGFADSAPSGSAQGGVRLRGERTAPCARRRGPGAFASSDRAGGVNAKALGMRGLPLDLTAPE
ncbi:MAG: hypothetical protein CL933_11750 [Deltaproteobacteria bacterium]|nr:hypothetical protein [Deltaproteobacteria bacterium]